MSLPLDALAPVSVPGTLLSPDVLGRPNSGLEDYEQGGIALSDGSQGLQVQDWRLRSAAGGFMVAATPYSSETSLFTVPSVTECSLSFDQNMHPTVAYIAAGQAKLYWYDTVTEMSITTDLDADITSVFVTMDDKREKTNARNDILLFYLRSGGLYYRQQRDRYTIERLLTTYEGVDFVILSAGMNDGLRMQIELGPLIPPEVPPAPPAPPIIAPGNEPPTISPLYEWRFKTAAEHTYLEAEFISRLPEDDWVVSCAVTIVPFYGVDPMASAILVDSIELRETQVTQWVAGGVEGNIYLVTFDAVSFLGHTPRLHTILAISSPVRTQ